MRRPPVLDRKKARDPMAVAQEIITDLRRDNAALTRVIYATLGSTRVPPKPRATLDRLMAMSIGCLIGRHRWASKRDEGLLYDVEICTFCAKTRIADQDRAEEIELPASASVPPSRGHVRYFAGTNEPGPGLGDPIGGPVRPGIWRGIWG